MRRVTIHDVYRECEEADYNDAYWSFRGTEIVPRKMVEMIIKKCEKMMGFYTCDTEFTRGKKWAYDDIRAYAESLLMEFEEDDE